MTDSAAPPAIDFATQSEIDAFCDALWLEDGLSPNSLAAYRSDLQRYALWLAAQGRPRPCPGPMQQIWRPFWRQWPPG